MHVRCYLRLPWYKWWVRALEVCQKLQSKQLFHIKQILCNYQKLKVNEKSRICDNK